ncbi:uncharacterized protein [Nicotiana sylvestris]|uniref:uncharacterized protein n=1 Tax=Nicotiana sylvestris TaxID=4096 RepID=UPI00388C6A7A
MTPNELKYSPIEKLCLALVFSIQKLKHYFQAHIVRLVSRVNRIKFVMFKLVLSDELARWYLQFQQFEIVYVPQNAVKGQALADFLADHPILDDWELSDELPDEDAMVIEIQPPWKMYFDGAAHREGVGARIVFITSQEEVLPYFFTLKQWCSNNVVEYQAFILGLEMAMDIKQLQLQVFRDSKLVINQILGSYEVKKPELVPYHKYAQRLENKRYDALAALASTLSLPNQTQVVLCQRWVVPPPNGYEEEESEVEHIASVLKKIHEGKRKSEGEPLVFFITRIHSTDDHLMECSYIVWGLMNPFEPCKKHTLELFGLRSEACQFHAIFIHQPPEVLHPTVASWPFDVWGLDVVGPLPKSSGGHLYILVVTDYFSKWPEVLSLKEIKKENVANFIRVNIIYRFGIPRYILTDNGKPFDKKLMNKIYDLFGFKQFNSSMYYAVANGLAEAFNKTLCKLLKKVVSKSKRDWHERMEEAFGHIGPHIAHQRKRLLIPLFMELKQSFHLSIKSHRCGWPLKKDSLMKKMLGYALKNWNLLMKIG